MNDEGNTIFSDRKRGSYIENAGAGEKIQLESVGDTFEMVLKVKKLGVGKTQVLKWT